MLKKVNKNKLGLVMVSAFWILAGALLLATHCGLAAEVFHPEVNKLATVKIIPSFPALLFSMRDSVVNHMYQIFDMNIIFYNSKESDKSIQRIFSIGEPNHWAVSLTPGSYTVSLTPNLIIDNKVFLPKFSITTLDIKPIESSSLAERPFYKLFLSYVKSKAALIPVKIIVKQIKSCQNNLLVVNFFGIHNVGATSIPNWQTEKIVYLPSDHYRFGVFYNLGKTESRVLLPVVNVTVPTMKKQSNLVNVVIACLTPRQSSEKMAKECNNPYVCCPFRWKNCK